MQEISDIDFDKDFADSLSREDIMGDVACLWLMEAVDPVERMQREFKVYEKARGFGILRAFKDLYKAYKQKAALGLSDSDGYKTQFPQQPITLNCGDWECHGSVRKVVRENIETASPIPVLVTGILKNAEDGIEKIELSFCKNGVWESVITKRSVAGSASRIIELADNGLEVNSENAKLLVKYIADLVRFNFGVIPSYKALGRLGWFNGEFLPYNTEVKFDGDAECRHLYEAVSSCGDFDEWVNYTHNLREDSMLLRLQMGTSFASPLIELVDALPFILHFWGGSGNGKTVGMSVASSIWGNPQKGCMWRALNNTVNFAMTASAFFHNLPVCLDELQTIKQNGMTYDKLIMCLTEGIDRGRMSYDKALRTKTWECAYIFTGEEPITREFSGGGAKNRVIELESTQKVIGDCNGTVEFVKKNYGHAGKRFIERVKNERDIKQQYKSIYGEILDTCDTTEKQAMSMALILLGDALAVKYIYTNEKPLKVSDIKQFLQSASEVDVSERAYDYVMNLVAANSGRFDSAEKTEIWGSIDDGVVSINKNILVREMSAKGFEFDAVKRKWFEKGYLIANTQGKFLHSTKINGIKASYIKLRTKAEENVNGYEYAAPF